MDLRGRHAIITGGGRGIGAAIARALASARDTTADLRFSEALTNAAKSITPPSCCSNTEMAPSPPACVNPLARLVAKDIIAIADSRKALNDFSCFGIEYQEASWKTCDGEQAVVSADAVGNCKSPSYKLRNCAGSEATSCCWSQSIRVRTSPISEAVYTAIKVSQPRESIISPELFAKQRFSLYAMCMTIVLGV